MLTSMVMIYQLIRLNKDCRGFQPDIWQSLGFDSQSWDIVVEPNCFYWRCEPRLNGTALLDSIAGQNLFQAKPRLNPCVENHDEMAELGGVNKKYSNKMTNV